ncbi:MAG: Ldh family oxidoreductase [Candidatus Saccharibacteria bacterium]
MKVLISELKQKVVNSLQNSFTKDESECIANYLLWAEMSGINTQGLVKMTGKEPMQNIKPQHEIRVERDTKLSKLINAGAYPAPLVSQQATDAAIQKAKKNGFAIVGVHNTFSSNGAQAYYAEQIADNDLIGIVMSRSPGSTAPFDSIDPLFGTNPIGFAFPTNDAPLTFDMATSAMTFFGLIIAKSKGVNIPDNMAIDKDGNPTNDPGAAMSGALLPFDRGYKGSGIGMVVEIMAGPLVASAYCDSETFDKEWGSTFIAIDPNLLVDSKQFKIACSDIIAKIKSSRKKANIDEMRIPGERARAAHDNAEKSGYVEVDDAILHELGYN